MMKAFAVLMVLLGVVTVAQADMYITEFQYSGEGGEFIEFTNVGATAIDMTGWSYDDESRIPGEFDLSGFGIVQPGESVVITEDTVADFIADWNLSGVQVLGEYTNNMGRNDEINLFDNGGNLVDRLAYGDENFPGTPRYRYATANPLSDAALGANDIYQWEQAYVGDPYGSWVSAQTDIGNPGTYVPEPASLMLLALGASFVLRRR
jgi:predicted extracellular nuclease